MTRVVQAAGRLIRSEDDRGVIALVCRRFLREPYVSLLPEEWWSRRRRRVCGPQDPSSQCTPFSGTSRNSSWDDRDDAQLTPDQLRPPSGSSAATVSGGRRSPLALARSRIEPAARPTSTSTDLEDPIQRLFNVLQPGHVHQAPPARARALGALRRPLRPGGRADLRRRRQGRAARQVLDPGGTGPWRSPAATGTPRWRWRRHRPLRGQAGPVQEADDKDFAPGFPAETDPRGSAVLMEWEHLLKRSR